jgi:cephalosporin hydroxylase
MDASMDALEQFAHDRSQRIARLAENTSLRQRSNEWMVATAGYKYTYNFSWLGVPVIQFPQDLLALQEITWLVRPDVIIETGIALGGSLVFHASMLELLGGNGIVIGVDVDIRSHNREQLERHPLYRRMRLIQGSSTDPLVARRVTDLCRDRQRVMVILDSDHTHDHVLRELRLYGPLVTNGSYLVVFDTSIEDAPADFFPDRNWGKGNNPKTAVREYLQTCSRFVIDKQLENKLLITVAPEGYLKCVAD